MTRADEAMFHVGQPVKVRAHGKGSTDGEIVRVGRDLVDIRTGTSVRSFRIQGQRLNGDNTGMGTVFRTLEQEAESERRSGAIKTIKRHGLLIGLDNRMSTDRLVSIAEFLEGPC